MGHVTTKAPKAIILTAVSTIGMRGALQVTMMQMIFAAVRFWKTISACK